MLETAAHLLPWLGILGVLLAWHEDNKRHEALTKSVLDRVSTSPRLELRPAEPVTASSGERLYIADHIADDEAWNDYRGEPRDEDDEI